jgi:hypothetical protein
LGVGVGSQGDRRAAEVGECGREVSEGDK